MSWQFDYLTTLLGNKLPLLKNRNDIYGYLTSITRHEKAGFSFPSIYGNTRNWHRLAVFGFDELTVVVAELIQYVLGVPTTAFVMDTQLCKDILKYNCHIVHVDSYNDFFDGTIQTSDKEKFDKLIIIDNFEKSFITYKIKHPNEQFLDASSLLCEIDESIEWEVRAQLDDTLNKKGIRVAHTSIPHKALLGTEIKKYSKKIYSANIDQSSTKELLFLFGNEQDYNQVVSEYSSRPVWTRRGNLVTYPDRTGKYFNFHNGERLYPNRISVAEHTLWIIGPCLVAGTYVTDEHSLGNILQGCINELITKNDSSSNSLWKVRCHATIAQGEAYATLLKSLPLKCGDIVCFIDEQTANPYANESNNAVMDISLLSIMHDALRVDDFFLDIPSHVNFRGMEIIATTVFDSLKDWLLDNSNMVTTSSSLSSDAHADSIQPVYNINDTYSDDYELNEYCKKLAMHRRAFGVSGAVVMNCNPFTYGHRYLVEQASQHVDTLFVFVVEEDKSYFPFRLRIEMVRNGVADLPNVQVLPSGRFVASKDTFSAYFNKTELQDETIDCSKDLTIFGSSVAKALGITKRFVGEEPLDKVTRQYNEAMKEILPVFGVEVTEIPRKEAYGNVISASRVRKQLNEKNTETIKTLIPRTTYDILIRENYM